MGILLLLVSILFEGLDQRSFKTRCIFRPHFLSSSSVGYQDRANFLDLGLHFFISVTFEGVGIFKD